MEAVKKFARVPVLLGAMLFFASVCFGRDFLYVLKFDKGELFSDFDAQKVSMSLSKEHGKDGKVCMKIEFKTNSSVGEWKPGRNCWDGYSKAVFHVFSEAAEERDLKFRVKGAVEPVNDPKNTFDTIIKIKPGDGDYTVDLAGAVCNDKASKLDIKNIYLYAFTNGAETPLTIYLSDFKLIK
jgi:hypothetical protein